MKWSAICGIIIQLEMIMGAYILIISVIFTGGTIASKTDNDTILLDKAPYELLKGSYEDITFKVYEPYFILSEDADFEHLKKLSECVEEAAVDSDAVIITHGTDSLVYSSAYIGYIFSDADIPIFFVSSGFPLDDKRANGKQNFDKAVELCKDRQNRGVYTIWYSDGRASVHPSVRLMRQLPYCDMLSSIGQVFSPPYSPIKAKDISPSIGRAVYLKAMPSMFYPELDHSVSGVLIECYHSGTLCSDKRFKDFVYHAKILDIPVFTVGTGGRDSDYETVKNYKSLGVNMLPMASPDAMYIKLCFAISIGNDIKEFMFTPYGGDFIE